MTNEALYDFYKYTVLPQFGLKDADITWAGSQQSGPDEFVHYMYCENVTGNFTLVKMS